MPTQGTTRISKKVPIIEDLFFTRWDASTASLAGPPIVTLAELQRAIRQHNQQHPDAQLSEKNPANFFKDFIRNRTSANANWPRSVWRHNYTARQITGEGNVFEFVQAATGQADPFPSSYPRDPEYRRYSLQSVSLPLLARLLGRQEETWLTQVAVQLYLIETHLAFYVEEFLHVSHLQSGIKQAKAEIDALYIGQKSNGCEVIITVEAKGRRDDILESQIVSQVRTVLGMRHLQSKHAILPMAVKIIDRSIVYVVAHEEIPFGTAASAVRIEIASEASYELRPHVPGIFCL